MNIGESVGNAMDSVADETRSTMDNWESIFVPEPRP